MKETGILFNAAMVRAILDGRKTMTRRVINPQPDYNGLTHAWHPTKDCTIITPADWSVSPGMAKYCPYGQPGDRMWVREAHALVDARCWSGLPCVREPDGHRWAYYREGFDRAAPRWRPSIHMPRWASRITLEITGVRVERLQEITEKDARAEGVYPIVRPGLNGCEERYYYAAFRELWESINAKRGYGWAVNPWCWVVEFRRIDAGAAQ
jgi:hypothetical protein